MCQNCENYEEIIKELCYDRAFGILTRNGLEYEIKGIKDVSNLYVVWMDFCDISKLNVIYGYEEVNKKFRELFKMFEKTDDLIGRCFSGDEIIVITDNTDFIVDLKQESQLIGLEFRYCISKFTGNLDRDLRDIYADIFRTNGSR